MDVIEAIKTRQSIRAFKPDPLPRALLEKVMEISLHSPSGSNMQPWSFVVVGGEQMEEMKQALVERTRSGAQWAADFPLPAPDGVLRERRRKVMGQMYDSLGIARHDQAGKDRWWEVMDRFFEAPNGIILCLEKSLMPFHLIDAGLILQTLMLAAHNYGLGTCVIYRGVIYPDILRKMFDIPDSKVLVSAVAIGYPNAKAPVNQFRSSREPMDSLVKWYGV
ncbi:MAG: nitroreductase [Dehalococcoidia bacterium]|nr:nitroreductase [Dehalococcoidia bacterium]